MNARYLILSTLLMGCALPIKVAYGQQSPRVLDLTMEVMAEDQRPDGFINRIELPPPSFFDSDSAGSLPAPAIIADEAIEEIREEAEVMEETVTDTIRESLSIDGTGVAGSPDSSPENTIVELPESVIDIIDNDLPLADSLQDTLDSVSDSAEQAVNDIVDVTMDTGVTDSVGELIEDSGGGVDDVIAGAALDSATGDTLDTVTDQPDNLAGELEGDLTEFTATPASDLYEADLAPTDELTDGTETEDLLEQSVQEVTDVLPGLLN